MWLYAAFILLPIRVRARLHSPPAPLAPGGLGARFSIEAAGPRSALGPGAHHAPFDDVAPDYDRCVGPFSGPIFAAALDALGPSLSRGSRVLDVGCGPGAALRRTARLVADGEVVGVDLSLAMLRIADEGARRAGLANVALYQADAAELPASFDGAFDIAYSCLVHHHLTDPHGALRSIAASLRPGGLYAAIDATGPRLTRLATPLTRAVDPGWVRFWERDRLLAQLAAAGLERVRWVPLAPGVGMAIGARA
jgi:ubiquinone/menaquinone biosynthesis C-methylase UbiE